jgi:hypothetical protein
MLNTLKNQALQQKSAKRLTNFSRILRSQIYCIFSISMGLKFIFDYKSWPMDLLTFWNPNLTIAFEVAIGHWICSILEDGFCDDEVISHIILLPNENRSNLHSNYSSGLLAHHILTIFAYSYSLSTHDLSGLCVFGFLFETPIILLNIRDLLAIFEIELNNPWKITNSTVYYQIYLILFSCLFHLTRTFFSLLWPFSLFFWLTKISKLSTYSQLVYHFLGFSFCYVNYIVYNTYIKRGTIDDLLRVEFISEETWRKMQGVKNIDHNDDISNDIHENNNNNNDIEKNEFVNKNNYYTKNKNITTTTIQQQNLQQNKNIAKEGLRLLGEKELLLHNSKNDGWISIEGKVYDITHFIDIHPGFLVF